MEKKLKILGQQQQLQQQPPTTTTTTTVEADLTSHQQQRATTPPCSSPRRRNAPIDIDTALRLQSQASYVQEPARGGGPASAAGTGTQKPLACSQKCTEWTSAPTNARSSGCDSNKVARNQQALGGCQMSHATVYQQQQQQQQRSNISRNNYYDHYNFCGAPIANNISVDYIDCLSNNDLIALTGSPNATRESGVAMRGIPSCRKHLSRFHRSHRIEPSQANSATGGDSSVGQQLHQATSSSGEGDDSPQRDGLKELRENCNTNTNNNNSSCLNTFNSINVDDGPAPLAENHPSTGQTLQASQSGVLYPISVSEAKKRTYFIGSVSQDSLLSHDELHRYFPNGRVSIFVCTWNQNRKRAPMNLNDLVLPERLVYMPDIYAIGIQEAYSSQQDYLREWEIELQTTLGPNHVLLHSCSLGALHLAIFIRRDLIWFCSTPEESLYNSRSMPTNMIKTKGAVSIAFRFFGTSFMFTNCHFPAHENKLKDRIDEYQRIINSIDLPKNLKLLKPRYLSNDSTARFDCVFFMGDLNFRLEHRTFDETIQILEDIFQSKEPSYEALTQNDELLKVMESQQAFHGFDESQIKFPPTYKFLAQTNKYDRQTKRVPSYTDRILFRSKRQRHIQCLIYDWLPQLLSSDHKPVYCLFDVLIRPGHEQNMVSSLNAGLFQRTIYMEALKRRAEDPDGMRENGAGGNLICSIS